ncbi:MAG: helix-turn-helix domain-containing protein [Clostridiaceae bacterium]|uniref:Helix-turn-helix domain-containing protein n=1 Tax=Clostridium porci TaxID=2605778 RepID=A0A7X2NKL4_9CLOT|nr:helix-turn-helix domain-containing protein [Clostridium porci]MCI7182336.1 helix-turn-helix domain-containing protein [Lachnospiraceae bacterium]MDY3232698.1 helix-turn-helix domain-containing protein [Clostridiaceae bacterium]MSS36646.1 helix-turn-helix domain-containing protein [Clostridium porci]
MYRNLDAEMARVKITQAHLARELGITPTTLSLKLNGKSNLSLKECVRIKRILRTDLSIDYLFAEDEKEGNT